MKEYLPVFYKKESVIPWPSYIAQQAYSLVLVSSSEYYRYSWLAVIILNFMI